MSKADTPCQFGRHSSHSLVSVSVYFIYHSLPRVLYSVNEPTYTRSTLPDMDLPLSPLRIPKNFNLPKGEG
jgi:hypothetical protein